MCHFKIVLPQASLGASLVVLRSEQIAPNFQLINTKSCEFPSFPQIPINSHGTVPPSIRASSFYLFLCIFWNPLSFLSLDPYKPANVQTLRNVYESFSSNSCIFMLISISVWPDDLRQLVKLSRIDLLNTRQVTLWTTYQLLAHESPPPISFVLLWQGGEHTRAESKCS